MAEVAVSESTPVTISDVLAVVAGAWVSVTEGARARVVAGRAVVDSAIAHGAAVYGLNTGLGHRRDEAVSSELLTEYQHQIISSHACAVGDPLPRDQVRAVMFARLAGLCRGYSGVSPAVLDGFTGLLNAQVHPVVPQLGSIGASDLGTLASVALVLIGRGRAEYKGEQLRGHEALARAGLSPLALAPKDALAMISANSYSIGVGAVAAAQAARAMRLADIAGALTMEALSGNLSPFDPEVARARPFVGQAVVADHILALVHGGRLVEPGAAQSLQDPLSIRTLAQVHGACREQVAAAVAAVTTELGGSGDNPMVSPDSGRAVSNGNFHCMEIALCFDALRVGLAHTAMISERRITKVGRLRWSNGTVDDHVHRSAAQQAGFSPPWLGGAALAAEIKLLAGPATLTVPPVDEDQEDHATFAPQSVRVTRYLLHRLELLLVLEILEATWVLMHRSDRRLGAGTSWVFSVAREVVAAADSDALIADVAAALHGELTAVLSDHVHVLDMTMNSLEFDLRQQPVALAS